MKLIVTLFFTFTIISCQQREFKVDTYHNLKKQLRGTENEKVIPMANPGEFEREVNNGGLNQYFFNSSGQNCFATLRYFQKNERAEEAKILKEAIQLINPTNIPEAELIEMLRKRSVDELYDSIISLKLQKLDDKYYQLK